MAADMTEADFSGWATKANLKCSDGRTIKPDAFAHQDQTKVPLVWQHSHSEPVNVLGHAFLENRPEGVYAYGFFNETPLGQNAKIQVQHGDITALSIYANKLREKNRVVEHGQIRELSLVLAGANPGALIDNVNIRHSDGNHTELDDEAVIYTGLELEHSAVDSEADPMKSEEDDIKHADDNRTVKDVFDTLTEDQKNVVYFMLGEAVKGSKSEVSHADQEVIRATFEALDEEQQNVVHFMIGEALEHAEKPEPTVEDVFNTLSEEQKNVVYFMLGEALKGGKPDASVSHSDTETVQDVFNSFNDEQKTVVAFMIGQALEHADENDTEDNSAAHADADTNSAAHADNQEGTTMANVFETGSAAQASSPTLSHSDLEGILASAEKRKTSFKTELTEYALAHGIDDIDVLFPDAKAVTTAPEFLARRTEWVADVMSGTRHTPFSRIKNLTANLTFEAARAKGYIKGAFKKEEFIRVSKRVTVPTTIYKKQKLDRDDILDITDFDVVAWLKGEMRLMLEEEIARAVLLGDGRAADDEDKISEENIRPIATDSDFYVTYLNVDISGANGSATSPEGLVDALTLNRRHYRGSGNPTLFTSETVLARLLLIKDSLGRRIYPTVTDLASALRVAKVVTVELMDEPTNDVLAIVVNLADYTIGADRGGDVAMFDDFDIDYNQQKYLIETRLSGALTKAKSALVVRRVAAGTTLRTPVTPGWVQATHSVTIPTTTGVTYKNKANNATLTGTVALVEDQELTVQAVPATGTDYLAGTAADEFVFTYEDGLVANGI